MEKNETAEPAIAYIAQGRLFVKLPGEQIREIESTFANQALARRQKSAEREGWKKDSVWGGGGMGMPELQQFQNGAPQSIFRFLHVCPGPEPGKIYYVLQMDAVVGVFVYDLAEDREMRLLHRDNFWLESVTRHRSEDLHAMSIRQEAGTVRLSTSKEQIRPTNHISGGESLDQLPDWVRDGSKRLVYQSAPMGRSDEGYALGVGSYAVDMLDVDAGKVETLLEDNEVDFLSPKMAKDGKLFFIQRPYVANRANQPSMLELLKDIVYFPYRLARTFFYFFNFLSTMFSGRPIANTLNMGQMDNRRQLLNLWGHMLDTQKIIKKKKKDKYPALVPADWELAMKNEGQSRSVLAKHVLCFDITDDGKAVYSNGSRIWFLDDGISRELVKGSSILSISVINLPGTNFNRDSGVSR